MGLNGGPWESLGCANLGDPQFAKSPEAGGFENPGLLLKFCPEKEGILLGPGRKDCEAARMVGTPCENRGEGLRFSELKLGTVEAVRG